MFLLVLALLTSEGGATPLGLGLLFSVLGFIFLVRVAYVLLTAKSRIRTEAVTLQTSLESAVGDAFGRGGCNISRACPCFFCEECVAKEDREGKERNAESIRGSSTPSVSTAGSASHGGTGCRLRLEPGAPTSTGVPRAGAAEGKSASDVVARLPGSASGGGFCKTFKAQFCCQAQASTRLFYAGHRSGAKAATSCDAEALPLVDLVTEGRFARLAETPVIPAPRHTRRQGKMLANCAEHRGQNELSPGSQMQVGDFDLSQTPGHNDIGGDAPQYSILGDRLSQLARTHDRLEEIVPCRARSSTVDLFVSSPPPYRRVVSSVGSRPAVGLSKVSQLVIRPVGASYGDEDQHLCSTHTFRVARRGHDFHRPEQWRSAIQQQQQHMSHCERRWAAEVKVEVWGDEFDHGVDNAPDQAIHTSAVAASTARNGVVRHELRTRDELKPLILAVHGTKRGQITCAEASTAKEELHLPEEKSDTFGDGVRWRGIATAIMLRHYFAPTSLLSLLSCLVAAGAAAACWTLSTNESYWLVHAFWHIFIMLSPFFAYRARD